MGRVLKFLLIGIVSLLGFSVVASIAILFFVDPNDYREEIANAVRDETGRELTFDGELTLSVFPWLALEMGSTSLGNAPGFSDEPFLRFDRASLSVRIIPLLLGSDLAVGTASIEGLTVNLEVASDGTTNWDDLSSDAAIPPEAQVPAGEISYDIDVGNILVSGANVSYTDAQAGSAYAISDLRFSTEAIITGAPFDLEGEFDFSAQPGDMGGHISISGTATVSDGAAQTDVDNFQVAGELRGVASNPVDFSFVTEALSVDTVAERMSPGRMELSILGVSMSADVEPFSYAGSPEPQAALEVREFSLKELMRALGIEPPPTADANALERVSFSANAVLGSDAVSLDDMALALDDSTMTGSLSLPATADGKLTFDLNVDRINLDDYMAPASDTQAAGDDAGGDVEIPVDMIRGLNAGGSFTIGQALFAGLEFTNLELGLQSSGGRMRLHPIAADFYDGKYDGDVRIDASGDLPAISLDEKLEGVNLAALASSLFEQDNVTGSFDGSFAMSGSGATLSAILADLDGNMAIELANGALEGTDIWHQLRSARAMFRQEAAPEPTLPVRTEFTAASATGTVTDGMFENNDLLVELPFLRITGSGGVNLALAEVDYSVEARVLEDPEFKSGLTADELADFTSTVVPIRISGAVGDLSIRPDIEEVFRQQVEGALEEEAEKLKNKLLRDLIGN